MANWTGSSNTDVKTGTSKSDRLDGRAGNDILDGRDGDDVLIGGAGADMLTGGRGRDTFVYKAAGESGVAAFTSDVITDFDAREGDKIDLSALGEIAWGDNAALGGGTASAWYQPGESGASLFVDLDGNGVADMRIDLVGVAGIAWTDLIGVSMPPALPSQPPAPPSPPEDAAPSLPVDVPSSDSAKPDAASIAEDATHSSVSGNVLSNDARGLTVTTVGGQQLPGGWNKTSAIEGEHGTLTIGRDGNWVYRLNNDDAAVQALGAGETRIETFTYTVTDKKGVTSTSTLKVTITGTNDAPVATADTAQTDEATTVTIAVLPNDNDKDTNDTLSVTTARVTDGSGVVTINADGTITYDPAGAYDALKAGETRDVVITYTVADGKGGTATSTATVTVAGKNNGGVQVATSSADLEAVVGSDQIDTVIYRGDGPVGGAGNPFVLPEGVENFEMEGSGPLHVKGNAQDNVIGLGTTSAASIDLSAGGSDSVAGTIAALDGVSVTGFGTDDSIVVEGTTPVRILAVSEGSAVLHLDTDGDDVADAMIRLAGDGLEGSKLRPNDFSITSGADASTIAFAPVNDAPVATGGDSAGNENTTITGRVGGTDAEGDALTYRLVSAVEGLTLETDGSYSFVPAQDFAGEVTFDYVANDGKLDSAPATVTILVNAVNDAPVALNGDAEGDEDAATISGSVKATDADGDALSYSLVEGPAEEQGTLTFGTDGSYSFVPTKDFNGDVTFTYRASDGSADSNIATVILTVKPVDELPPVVSIGEAIASEATGSIEIPVTLSHAADQDVTLAYEVASPARTITFDGLGGEHAFIGAGYGGLRWTDIASSGDGAALTATTGGGTIQALAPGELSLDSLTVSTASANQLVTIEAIRAGEVVATRQVVLGNGGERSSTVVLGPDFAELDAVRIDGSEDAFGSDYPIRIDDVTLSGARFTASVTIPSGQTQGTIIADAPRDGTVSVRLTEAAGASLGTDVEAVAIIADTGPEPLPMISFVNFFTTDVHEGMIQEFEVTRDSRINEALTVELESEFFGNQTVTFAPGETKVWATFGNTDDSIVEPNQPYEIRLASSPNYIAGATTSVSGMHIDNDGGTLNTAPTAWSAVTYIQEADFTIYGGTYSLAAYGSDAEGDKLTYELVGNQPAHGTISFDPNLGAGALMFTPNAGFLDTLHQGQTYEFTYQFTVSDSEFTTAPTTGTAIIYGSGSAASAEQPVDPNQTIIASTAASFIGGTGNDTLFFDAIPAGSPQLLGGSTVTNAVISLGGAIVGTPYAGKMISNIENLTFENIAGPSGRTLTINGDAGDNTITVVRTVRKTDINGGDGNDTITFTGATGTGSESQGSILSGGRGNDTFTLTHAATIDDRVTSGLSGDDTYVLGSGRQELRFGANSGNDTIRNFSLTEDVLDFTAAGIDASTVTVMETNGNTVFTINGTSTLTVQGVTGMQFGTHWTAQGTYTPPAGQEPAGEPGIVIEQTDGSTQVTEGGATDTLQISLATAPTADVTVDVWGDGWQVTPVPGDDYGWATLTFTPANWNIPQVVTISAIDDTDAEGATTGGLWVSTGASDDPLYNYLYPQNSYVPVSVTDNDTGETVNTAPSALNVAKDTYDTDLSLNVEGFGYDNESGVTYRIVTQPREGTVSLNSDGSFHFEGNSEFLDALKRGEIKPVTFQYAVSDGELTSEPATITINVHGTDPGDETIQAFTRTTPSQTDFFPLDGKDGNDTVVFHSVTLTSGTGLEISLSDTIKWTEYAGKALVNIENITIKDTNGNLLRTMTVGGDSQANVITIENTNHKLTILGRGGDDIINFKGTGNGLTSVINGGAGNDTVNAHSAVIVNVAEGNDTVNVFGGSNVTVRNFTAGDKINFAAGIEASNVSAAVQGTNTVFTILQDGVTSTVTVEGATGLIAETDWTAGSGVDTPPTDTPPTELPVISALSATAEVTEGGIATFTFTRTGDLSQPLTVGVDTNIGSAVAGTDFTAPSTITFAAGLDTAILEVQTLTDADAEETATIEVRLVAGEGYVIGAAVGNVTDLLDAPAVEPEPVLPSLSIDDVTVSENAGTASFTVTLSAPAEAAVSVDYATAPASGPADAFSPASGTLTFEPGETTKTIEIQINDNGAFATAPQKFVVTLSNASGATLADLSGEGIILDDDLPAEMPALTIETVTGLDEFSTISWNAIPGAASYVLIGIEPDEPNFPPHTLGFAVAPSTSYVIDGNDEFTGMVVVVEARDANGDVLARSENQTDLIANVNDVPTGRPVISDNSPEVGQLLTISIGDLEDGDGMRADRPDEFGYIWQRSTDGETWALVSTTDSYQVTAADTGYFIRGAARYEDRGATLETVYSLTTAKVGDPNPNTPPVAFDDAATTLAGQAVTIDALENDFDFEYDLISIAAHSQPANGSVIVQDGKLVYTPNANFVGTDAFEYTLNGGDTGKVTVTVEQLDARPLTLLTVDNLDENSTLSWTAVPGAVSYVFIGTEPDDPTAPPHELGFALAPATSFNINGDDEFVGMAIHIEARSANGTVITRSVNQTGIIENINDIPTGNLGLDDMTPQVGQMLTLGYGTFEDGDGYRDRGREDEFQWAIERSPDGVTWTTITTGPSAGEDGPFGFSYTVTQADDGQFLRGRAIYEDRAGDTIETVYSLSTSRVGTIVPGEGDGNGTGGDTGNDVDPGSLVIAWSGDAIAATELGDNGSFTIALADAPTANVTVMISGDNQIYGQGPDGGSELVFTPETWSEPQTVTVIAIEDGVAEGPHAGDIWLDAYSDDPRYDGLIEQHPVSVIDSAPEPDPLSFVSVGVDGTGVVTEGGEIVFNFMRREGVNTDPMEIVVKMDGLDASDIEKILWNGVEDGVKGFRAGSATATMTVVLADNAIVEGDRYLDLTVLATAAYLDDFDNFASALVLDDDVAQAEPVNRAPSAGNVTVDLTEDNLFAEIAPDVTDADGDPTTIRIVGAAPTGVTFDEATQRFVFEGDAAAFDALNTGETETIAFQYVANDGARDSDPGTITIAISGITDPAGPQIDPEPARFADPYNYDFGNGGPAGARTSGDDILNDAADLASTIHGFGGNDTIYGRDLNDLLVGGNGDDILHGGSGDDTLNGDGGGTGPNNTGTPGDDRLYGGDGADTINGQNGNDILVGGHGADILNGGLGDDTFVFLDIFDRGDTITMQGQLAASDVFDFREFDFDPNGTGRQGAVDGLQVFNEAPVEGQMLEDAFYYDRSSGKMSLNTGADGLEDFHVTLLVGNGSPLPQINADDFVI